MLNGNFGGIEGRAGLSRPQAEPEEKMPAAGDMGRVLQSPAHKQFSCRPSSSLHTMGTLINKHKYFGDRKGDGVSLGGTEKMTMGSHTHAKPRGYCPVISTPMPSPTVATVLSPAAALALCVSSPYLRSVPMPLAPMNPSETSSKNRHTVVDGHLWYTYCMSGTVLGAKSRGQ